MKIKVYSSSGYGFNFFDKEVKRCLCSFSEPLAEIFIRKVAFVNKFTITIHRTYFCATGCLFIENSKLVDIESIHC